jgi:hypothetical protein
MRLQRPSPAMLVALLALFVALGGTGYAVVSLPKNSVGAKQLKKNAVTAKKIKKNAVGSPKVKDFSLLARDFKLGQLPNGAKGDQGPPGPTFAAVAAGSLLSPDSDPPASPDGASSGTTDGGRHFDFSLPAGGRIYVRFFIPGWSQSCTVGGGRFGLYLDGAPVPKSSRPLSSSFTVAESVAVVPAGAGSHSLEAREDCPDGNLGPSSISTEPTWTVILLAG